MRDNNEFKKALRDIAGHASKLANPYGKFYIIFPDCIKILLNKQDRVRCSEWARKLASLPDDNLESSKIRNEYIQFLRIQVRNNFLHGPFLAPPPDSSTLSPLAENLGNLMAQQVRRCLKLNVYTISR